MAKLPRMQRLILAALLLLSLPSCFLSREAINEPIDVLAVQQLQPGKSSALEVVELLGAPTEVIQLGRRSAYRYDASVEKSSILTAVAVTIRNSDLRQDRVWVFLDENDVLTHYGATFSTHHPQYAFIWEDVHEKADSEARDAHRPGLEPDNQ